MSATQSPTIRFVLSQASYLWAFGSRLGVMAGSIVERLLFSPVPNFLRYADLPRWVTAPAINVSSHSYALEELA